MTRGKNTKSLLKHPDPPQAVTHLLGKNGRPEDNKCNIRALVFDLCCGAVWNSSPRGYKYHGVSVGFCMFGELHL